MKKTRMRYDELQDQWVVVLNGKEYGVHCGERFELFFGEKAIPCQIELAKKWYVIMENTRLDLQENDQYLVNI